ncbi:MAG: glycosyltransferase family 4 protein [Bacteroidia bacterium]|jgi:glycosyltransferase involved in cell wall biosynthesis|nr:glycosyltransferase family 4 protein [Bacteroidia bacterium]
MRIGFDAKRAFNNKTGLGNFSRFLIKQLVQQFPEHEYFLFTPKINPDFANFVSGKNVHIISPEQFLHKRFSWWWRSNYISSYFTSLQLDVFHGLSNELPLNSEKTSTKLVVTIHDLIFLRYPQYYPLIDRLFYKLKFKSACTRADRVHAISRQTAKDILQFYAIDESKIHTIYQSCDEQFLHASSIINVEETYALKTPYFISVGTPEQRKKQDFIIKAFAQSNTNHSLVFVGKETPFVQQLKSLTQSLNLTDRVQFLHQVPFHHFPSLYRGATASVYASEFEGFGIPVLESLACKTPVFAAHTSSLTEAGAQLAKYFDDAQPSTLTQLFNTPVEPLNDEEWNAYLLSFNPQTLGKQYMDLYLDLFRD